MKKKNHKIWNLTANKELAMWGRDRVVPSLVKKYVTRQTHESTFVFSQTWKLLKTIDKLEEWKQIRSIRYFGFYKKEQMEQT